jgi:hypothetical protein
MESLPSVLVWVLLAVKRTVLNGLAGVTVPQPTSTVGALDKVQVGAETVFRPCAKIKVLVLAPAANDVVLVQARRTSCLSVLVVRVKYEATSYVSACVGFAGRVVHLNRTRRESPASPAHAASKAPTSTKSELVASEVK